MVRNKTVGVLYKNNRVSMLYLFAVLSICLSLFTLYKASTDSFLSFSSLNLTVISSGLGIVLLLAAGNAFLVCILWLNNRYVTRIERIDEFHLLITTWSLFGKPKTKKHLDIVLRKAADPIDNADNNLHWTPDVKSPWVLIKTARGKKLIVDQA